MSEVCSRSPSRPDYASSRLLYVYFTDRSGDIEIAELHADGDGRHADAATLRPILVVPHPNHSNHNGGQLQFGPDGLLYAGTGDGGGEGDQPDNAQNPNSRLGKLLRIDPVSGAVGIYSIGLRNPYRFSFDLVSDPAQPRIAIGDVGQDRFEEIDYLPLASANGANFGWNDFEGFAPFAGAHPPTPAPTVKPIKVYSISGAACAIDRRLRRARRAAALALPPLRLRGLLHGEGPLPDSAPGGCTQGPRHGRAGARPELVRRDDRRLPVRHLAGRPRLQVRAPALTAARTPAGTQAAPPGVGEGFWMVS